MSRWVKFILVMLVGLGAGLLFGWVISPVEYKDTNPSTLRYDYQTDYVLMVAEVYDSTKDMNQALRQLALLGSNPPSQIVLQSMAHALQLGYSSSDLTLIQNLATSLQSSHLPQELPTP